MHTQVAIFLSSFAVFLFSLSTGLCAEEKVVPKSQEQISFEKRLMSCRKDEILCLSYREDFRIADYLVIDLREQKIIEETCIFSHATRSQDSPRRLASNNVNKLKTIIENMPESHAPTNPLDTVMIAYWKHNQLIIRSYSRQQMPNVVCRIYDMGGGQIEGKFVE